jgi:hypothetical protein
MFSIRSVQSVYKKSWGLTVDSLRKILSAVLLCKGGWEEMVIQFIWGNSWQAVLNKSRRRKDLNAGSWRISTVRSLCQGTAGEDIAGWIKLSGCCGELWIVENSGSSIVVKTPECIRTINPIIPSNSHPPGTCQYFHTENTEFFKDNFSSPVWIHIRYHSASRQKR